MSDEEQNYVELTDEYGGITKCEVYDVVDFEDKTYALLMPLDEEEDEDAELIVLEYIENGEDSYFQSIDDEDEFNRVCAYIQSIEEDDDDDGE